MSGADESRRGWVTCLSSVQTQESNLRQEEVRSFAYKRDLCTKYMERADPTETKREEEREVAARLKTQPQHLAPSGTAACRIFRGHKMSLPFPFLELPACFVMILIEGWNIYALQPFSPAFSSL